MNRARRARRHRLALDLLSLALLALASAVASGWIWGEPAWLRLPLP